MRLCLLCTVNIVKISRLADYVKTTGEKKKFLKNKAKSKLENLIVGV